jgi:hypothetical protein
MLNTIYTLMYHFAASDCDPNRTFFGIPVWYKYIAKAQPGACDFTQFKIWPPDQITLIGVALLDGMLRLAGIVAIGFIMYGGAQYITSQGESDRVKSALSTIINALIGLGITMVAVAFVTFLGNRLGG